jgi:hypothetical protein
VTRPRRPQRCRPGVGAVDNPANESRIADSQHIDLLRQRLSEPVIREDGRDTILCDLLSQRASRHLGGRRKVSADGAENAEQCNGPAE